MNLPENSPMQTAANNLTATPKHREQNLRRSKTAKPSRWISSLAICALAVSTFTATTASSEPTYSCPTGFDLKDYWSEPLYCDKLIQEDTAFTVPEGVTQISVMAFGGGGAGGGGGETAGNPKAGGGGGAGEITQASLTVVRDEVLTITVGAGGSRGTVNAITGVATNGGDGGTTTVRDSANTVRVSAVGGKGGKSGTSGGNGGASGNSTLANVNPGGTGFNSNGRSSGGGGGGFSTDGVDGALLVGGNGGQGNLIGDFGFPFSTNTQMSWSSIVVGEYPGLKNLYIDDLGHGGGGAVVILSEDTPAGTNGESHPGESMGAGAGHVVGSGGHWAGSGNLQAQAYPGQGGSGGAGFVANSDSNAGSDGVAGAVWLRVLAILEGGGGGGGGGGSNGTFFDTATGSLPFGGSLEVTHDATAGAWLGLWVNGVYMGPAPFESIPLSYDWEMFEFFAACNDQDMTLALFGDDVSYLAELPDLATSIDYIDFIYRGDPELCGSGGGGGGGTYTPAPEAKLNPCQAVASAETVSKNRKAFPGFAVNSAVPTKAMKKEIRSFLRKHPREVCVSVAGFTMGPRVKATDPKLARDRARAVRAYIKSLRPEAAFTKVTWRTEKRVGNNVRRATVTLRY